MVNFFLIEDGKERDLIYIPKGIKKSLMVVDLEKKMIVKMNFYIEVNFFLVKKVEKVLNMIGRN